MYYIEDCRISLLAKKATSAITTSIFHSFKENNENDMAHTEFVLIFITGPSRAKLGRMAQQQLLTLASLVEPIAFRLE